MNCASLTRAGSIVFGACLLAHNGFVQTALAQSSDILAPAAVVPSSVAPDSQASEIARDAMFTIPGFAPSTEPRVRVRTELIAWYMAPGGELRMPRESGPSATLDIDPFGFDTPQVTAVPEINVYAPANPQASNWLSRRGWRVGGRAFVFGDDNRTLVPFAAQIGERAITAGESVRSSLDYASAELEAGVMLHTYASESTDEQGTPSVSSSLEAIAGLQAIDCKWRVTIADATQEASASSVGILGGGKLAFAFGERFLVDVTITASIGLLGDEMAAADVVVGGSYMITNNLGLQIGYRSAFFSLAGDDGQSPLDYAGSHQGLMFGLALRF